MGNVLTYSLMTAIGIALAVSGYCWRRLAARKYAADKSKKNRRTKTLTSLLFLLGCWLAIYGLLKLLFGNHAETEGFEVEIWAERVQVGGYSLSTTVIISWIIMAVLLLAALLIRIFVIPKFRDKPGKFQNVLELIVETVCKYTKTSVGDLGDNLPAYILSLACFMVGCAAVELLGYRAPTADITMTFALALITFILINYYGIKKKGVVGRIKSLAKPTPVVFPMKIVSDLAVPVSLACRLFGNMLGGMIVMDLLYYALGSAAIGIPSVLGLYFNLFHPLIQTFIFVTLTLTFINEAVE